MTAMKNHYLLWATGEDQPGIVAGVTEQLFHLGCNIEDSSMMRLGSEFGILLIFSSHKKHSLSDIQKEFFPLEKRLNLTLGIKAITSAQAKFRPTKKASLSISLHGTDQPGLVHKVTFVLAQQKFNITDLATHRTNGKKAGFILILEGELSKKQNQKQLEKALSTLSRKLSMKISLNRIEPHSF